MGYRSDIVLVFAFREERQIDEVLAVYPMHPFVQAHNLTKEWSKHRLGEHWGLSYRGEYVKWYDSYEDVQGFEYMRELVQKFADERGDVDLEPAFPFAYRKLRVGEEDADVEHETTSNDDDLMGILWDKMNLRREIETEFE